MGISDEEYAAALEKHFKQKAQDARQRQTEKEMIRTSIVDNNINTIAVQNTAYIQQTIGLKPMREEDLKQEAMQVPLSALIDMWTVKFGGSWVPEQEFMDEDFWRLALLRLLGANKLEKHHLVNQFHCVYRIIE